jgi:sialate O-acetylesterase
MILSWREAWGKELPFYFVQIAPYRYGNKRSALLREQQTASLAIPGTGMVLTSDLTPDTSDIHPKRKQEVGYRLADLALTECYRLPGLHPYAPMYERHEVNGSKVSVYFSSSAEGLVCKDKSITGFELAGADGIFYPAAAKTGKGNLVVLTSEKVKVPVSVRYCFTDTAVPNLFNTYGLPVNSFRSR